MFQHFLFLSISHTGWEQEMTKGSGSIYNFIDCSNKCFFSEKTRSLATCGRDPLTLEFKLPRSTDWAAKNYKLWECLKTLRNLKVEIGPILYETGWKLDGNWMKTGRKSNQTHIKILSKLDGNWIDIAAKSDKYGPDSYQLLVLFLVGHSCDIG